MATAAKSKDLRQYKSRFFFIVDQVLALSSSINFVRKVGNLAPNFKQIA